MNLSTNPLHKLLWVNIYGHSVGLSATLRCDGHRVGKSQWLHILILVNCNIIVWLEDLLSCFGAVFTISLNSWIKFLTFLKEGKKKLLQVKMEFPYKTMFFNQLHVLEWNTQSGEINPWQ